MKIQLDWLKNYVDHGLSADELSRLLTMAGLELEAAEQVELSDGRKTDVMELNVTPNRGYCLNHIGVAREVAALTNKKLICPTPNEDVEKAMGSAPVDKRITVLNEADDLCPRYAAMVIENVKVGPSPQWLADRLTAIGLRPINNIVDITNFVMMEYGQPLHAFDHSKLAGSKIVVRTAKKGEPFTSLDGEEYKLDKDTLVIADGEKPVALAGVMGGTNSQVSLETKTVVLESAFFDPVAVRKASKKYQIRTDSSYRFERGVDIEGVISAQSRAALLMKEIAGGEICRGRVDIYPQTRKRHVAAFRISRTNKILGTQLAPEKILGILESLGISIKEEEAGEAYFAEIPYFRPALVREIDLIEEVARLNGFENTDTENPVGSILPVRSSPMQEAVRKGRETLCNLGYSETVNYSFVEEEYAKDFLTAFGNAKDSVIPLRNPISGDMGTMRTSLLPGLIKTAARNISRGQKTVKIFETGHAFLKSKGGKNIIEKASIAGLVTGPYEKNVWKDAGRFYDFYDLKGTLEGLMEAFKLDLAFSPFNKTFLTSGRAVDIKANGKHIAFLGELSETLAQKFDFDKKVFVFEMDVEAMVKEMPGAVEFNSIPKFPETYRDISILIDKTIQSGTVCELIRKASGPLISKVELYDQFEGKKLDKGKKSLTLALSFQSPDKTLTDEEVNPIFEKIVKTLNKELGASLRE